MFEAVCSDRIKQFDDEDSEEEEEEEEEDDDSGSWTEKEVNLSPMDHQNNRWVWPSLLQGLVGCSSFITMN